MTPDLMEAGRRAPPGFVGARDRGRRHAGEVDVTHGRILYLEDVSVSFDGFKAINKLSLDIAPGRAALHHRPQRRRQDHDDGHHHRQDAARRGTVFFGSTIDLLRHKEAEIAQLGIGRKFQKPTVFEQLTVFENLELALKTDKGVKALDALQARFGAERPAGRGAAHHPPGRQRARAWPAT